MSDINKVVLAYSGGLDTSVIVRWLQDTYGCEVVTFTADIGQGEEVEPARAKAEALGVKEIYIEDLREEFVRDYVFPMFRANTIYEGEYLLGTSIARPLISKRLVRDIHTVQLSTWGFAVSLTAGALLMPYGAPVQMPTMLMLGSIAIVFIISASAYYAITASTRLAQASFVAPFRYTRLLFALVLGSAVFGEVPDMPTIIGAGIIIISGLYSLFWGQT